MKEDRMFSFDPVASLNFLVTYRRLLIKNGNKLRAQFFNTAK